MKSNLIYSMVPRYKFVYEDKTIDLPIAISTEIQNYWDELMAAGKIYTNGDLYTVADIIEDDDGCLIFKMVKTNFAHYIYTVKLGFQGEYICRSIAASALFLTSDNYYVLGKMSSTTSLADKIKFIGGAIHQDDLIENVFQAFECVKREAREELGIELDNQTQVESITPNCFITRKNLSFINVCFKVKLKFSSSEVSAFFAKFNTSLRSNNMEQELDSIVIVKNTKTDVLEFLDDNKDCIIDYMQELFFVELGIHQPRNFFE